MKALIIDDSKVILKVHSNLISELIKQIKIFSYQSPLEAIEKIKENSSKYDLALIDYNMEGLNGIELGELLIDEGYIERSRVSIVSANIQMAVKEKVAAAGFHFFDKPLCPEGYRSFLLNRGFL